MKRTIAVAVFLAIASSAAGALALSCVGFRAERAELEFDSATIAGVEADPETYSFDVVQVESAFARESNQINFVASDLDADRSIFVDLEKTAEAP